MTGHLSSKPAAELKPPPKGPAPGARPVTQMAEPRMMCGRSPSGLTTDPSIHPWEPECDDLGCVEEPRHRIGYCYHGPECSGTGPDCDMAADGWQSCAARLAEAEGDLAAAIALLREARFAIPGRPFPAETIDAFLAAQEAPTDV